MRIPCTCGCGRQVTYATKQNHLNGRGKTSLRARVLAENEWLRQRRQDHQQEGSKRRSHPTSDRDGSRKRSKTVQLEMDEVPKIFQADKDPDPLSALVLNQAPADTDPVDPLSAPGPNQSSERIQADADPTDPLFSPVPNQVPEMFQTDAPSPLPNNIELDDAPPNVLSSKRQSSRIAERTSRVVEQRWGNRHLEDQCSANGGGDTSSEDGAEDDAVESIPEIGDDEDSGEESVSDDDNEDPDNSFFAESDVAGISAWDLLGEGFEREAAAIG